MEDDIRPSLTERLGYHGLGKLGPHWAFIGLENLWEKRGKDKLCKGKRIKRPKFNREIGLSWVWKTWASFGYYGLWNLWKIEGKNKVHIGKRIKGPV